MDNNVNVGLTADLNVKPAKEAIADLRKAIKSLEGVDIKGVQSTLQSPILQALKSVETGFSGMVKSFESAQLQMAKAAEANSKSMAKSMAKGVEDGVRTVKQQLAKIQAEYEASVSKGTQHNLQELQKLRQEGVRLFAEDRRRLISALEDKSLETAAGRAGERARKALDSALTKSAGNIAPEVLLGLPKESLVRSAKSAAATFADAFRLDESGQRAGGVDARRLLNLGDANLRKSARESAAVFESEFLKDAKGTRLGSVDARKLLNLTDDSLKKSARESAAVFQAEFLKDSQGARPNGVNARDLLNLGDESLKKSARESAAIFQAEFLKDSQGTRPGAVDVKRLLGISDPAIRSSAKESAAVFQAEFARQAALMNQALKAPAGDYSVWNPNASGSRYGTTVHVNNAAELKAKADAAKLAEGAFAGLDQKTKSLAASLVDGSGRSSSMTKELNALHSAARGVASGFNAMWLTWGQLGPLLAGAAFSNLFVQAVKQGKDFESTLSVIDHLAEASGSEMLRLRDAALELGSAGKYGPIEIAGGLKTLALAGLSAQESLAAIGPAMQFATVSELPLDKAAESVMGIATSFGYAADDISKVGDVIAKTAAVSMSSVQDMTEAFKQSSTVAQQFGATIEDQSAILGILAQIGIRGSSAGTAVRNMYVELMGSSKKARAILQETLKVDIFDNTTKAVKPLKTIFEDLGKSLSRFNFKDQIKILNDLGNERGMKAIAAGLESMSKKAQASGQDLSKFVSQFDDMQAKLEEAAGFMAVASAGMASTTENIMKSVGNALQGSLIKAFDEISPYLIKFSLELRDAFRSDEFVEGIKTVVRAVGDFLKVLYENAETLATLGAAYLTWKVAAVAVIAPISLLAGAVQKTSVALTGQALAMTVTGTASGAMAAGVTTAANASILLSRGLNALKLALGPIAILASAAAAAYMYFADDLTTAADKSEDAHARMRRDAEEAAQGARLQMQVTQESLDKEIERIETFLKNGGDEKKTQEELANAAVTASQMKVLANADEAAAIKLTAAALKEMEAAQVAAYGMGGDRNQRVASLKQEAEALRQQAEAIQSGAQAEVDRQNASIQRLRALRAEEDRVRAAKRPKVNHPSGTDSFSDESKSAKERLNRMKLDVGSELAQIKQRYTDRAALIKEQQQNEQSLLKAQRDAELISVGAYYAQELSLVNRYEQERLAAIQSTRGKYTEQLLADIAEANAAYEARLAEIESKKSGKQADQLRKEALESLQSTLVKLGETADTTFQQLNNDERSIKDGAFTRVQLQAIQAEGSIRTLKKEYQDFWKSEAEQKAKAAREDALEDRVRYAAPEEAVAIRAAAAEQERYNALIVKQDEVVRKADEALKDYVAELEMEWQVTEEQTNQLKLLADALALVQKQRDQLKGAETVDVAAEAERAVARFRKEEAKRLTDDVTDAIVTGLIEGGQAGKGKLRDLIVAELRKPITLAVQAFVQPLIGNLLGTGGGVGGVGGSSGFAQGLGLGSFMKGGGLSSTGILRAGDWLATSSNDTLASIGGYLQENSSQLASFSKTAGDVIGYANALNTAFSRNAQGGKDYGKAAGQAIGTYFGGPFGSLIGGELGSALGIVDYGGTYHSGGYGAYSRKGGVKTGATLSGEAGFGLRDSDIKDSANFAAVKVAQTVVGILDGVSGKFGKDVGYYAATAFADDISPDGAWGSLMIKLGDKVLLDWKDTQTSKWAPKEFADGDAGLEEYDRAVAKDVRDLLIKEAPAWAADVFKALGETPTLEELAAASENVSGLVERLEVLGSRAIPALANASEEAIDTLIDAAGGIDQLNSSLQVFYDNFGTDADRYGYSLKQLTDGFKKLGITLPGAGTDLGKWYTNLVQTAAAQDLTNEANAEHLSTLLSYAPAVKAVNDADKETQNLLDQLAVSKGLRTQNEIDLQNQLAGATSAAQAALMRMVNASMTAASIWSSLSSELQGYEEEETAAAESASASSADDLQQKLVSASKGVTDFVEEILKGVDDKLKNSRLDFLRAQKSYKADLEKAMTSDPEAMESVVKSAETYLTLQKERAASVVDVRRAKAMMAYEMSQIPKYTEEGGGGASNKKPLSAMELLKRAIQDLTKSMKALMIAINETELTPSAYQAFIKAVGEIATALEAIKKADISVTLKLQGVGILDDLTDTLNIAVTATWLDDGLKELVAKAGTALARAIKITVSSQHSEASIKEALDSLDGIQRTLRILTVTENMDPATRALALAANGSLSTTVSIAMSTQGMSAADITNVLEIVNTADKVINITANADWMTEEMKQVVFGSALPAINKTVRLAVEDFKGEDKDIIFAATQTATKNIKLAIEAADPEALRLALAESLAVEAIVSASNGVLSPEVQQLLSSGDVNKMVQVWLQTESSKYETDLANLTAPKDMLVNVGLEDTTAQAALAEYERDRTVNIAALLQPGDTAAELAQFTADRNVFIRALFDAGATPEQIAALTKATDLDILAVMDVSLAIDKKAGITAPAETLIEAILDTTDATTAKEILTAHDILPVTAELDDGAATSAKDQLISHATAFLDADLDTSAATGKKDELTDGATAEITAVLKADSATEMKNQLTAPATVTITASLNDGGVSAALDALTQPRSVNITHNVSTVETVFRYVVDAPSTTPQRARGGYTPPGVTLVGENGPELVNFREPSMIYRADQTAQIMKSWGEIPQFAVGTNELPADMLAMVHKGERIIPAADNRELMAAIERSNALSITVQALNKALSQMSNSAWVQPLVDSMVENSAHLNRIKRKLDEIGVTGTAQSDLLEAQKAALEDAILTQTDEILSVLKDVTRILTGLGSSVMGLSFSVTSPLASVSAGMSTLNYTSSSGFSSLSVGIQGVNSKLTTISTALGTLQSATLGMGDSISAAVRGMADAVASALAAAVNNLPRPTTPTPGGTTTRPPGGGGTTTPPPGTTNTTLDQIKAIYEGNFGRPAESAGIDYWLGTGLTGPELEAAILGAGASNGETFVRDYGPGYTAVADKYGQANVNNAMDYLSSAVASGDAIGIAQAAIEAGVSSRELSTLLTSMGVVVPASEIVAFAQANGLPKFAAGGLHRGGLRLVGENGPEIEATGAARIWSADQTREFMGGGDDSEAVELLTEVLDELRSLRFESQATAGHTARTAKILSRVTNNGDALVTTPAE